MRRRGWRPTLTKYPGHMVDAIKRRQIVEADCLKIPLIEWAILTQMTSDLPSSRSMSASVSGHPSQGNKSAVATSLMICPALCL